MAFTINSTVALGIVRNRGECHRMLVEDITKQNKNHTQQPCTCWNMLVFSLLYVDNIMDYRSMTGIVFSI